MERRSPVGVEVTGVVMAEIIDSEGVLMVSW